LECIADPENAGVPSINLNRLYQDLKVNGQKEPVEVSMLGGYASLADGHHRLREAQRLGWATLWTLVLGEIETNHKKATR
jgi:ParB-like chromosome segregation protein Spo0J